MNKSNLNPVYGDYKQCPQCGEYKEVAQFHKDSYSSDGLRSRCKECHKTYIRSRSTRKVRHQQNSRWDFS